MCDTETCVTTLYYTEHSVEWAWALATVNPYSARVAAIPERNCCSSLNSETVRAPLLSSARIRGKGIYLLQVHPQGWQGGAGKCLRVRILAGGDFLIEQCDGPAMVLDLRLDI